MWLKQLFAWKYAIQNAGFLVRTCSELCQGSELTSKDYYLYCKNGAGKFLWKNRQIYRQFTCILAPHAVYLRCRQLQVIFSATTSIFKCWSAFRTSGGLHVVHLRVKWGLSVVQGILLERHGRFYVPVAGNFTEKSRQIACIFHLFSQEN